MRTTIDQKEFNFDQTCFLKSESDHDIFCDSKKQPQLSVSEKLEALKGLKKEIFDQILTEVAETGADIWSKSLKVWFFENGINQEAGRSAIRRLEKDRLLKKIKNEDGVSFFKVHQKALTHRSDGKEDQVSFSFDEERPKSIETISSPFKNIIILLPQAFLVLLMTFFLLKESVAFYEAADTQNISPWIKAALVEGLLLMLAATTGNTRLKRLGIKALMIGVFMYATWSFSTHVFSQKMSSIQKNSLQMDVINDLEKKISTNDELIQKWAKTGWIGAVRRLNAKNMELQEKLNQERERLLDQGAKVSKAEMSNLWALVVFRILIQISNLFFSHRLADQLRHVFSKRQV